MSNIRYICTLAFSLLSFLYENKLEAKQCIEAFESSTPSSGSTSSGKTYTPEMFGAKGDGYTDDYEAIQKMLDTGEEGCTFLFTKGKTYYNAFKNNGYYTKADKRREWRRTKGATFLFNGSKLRRRTPQWNDRNKKGNENEGAFYTDEQSALLYLSGDGFTVDGADFSSGLPLGVMLDDREQPTKFSGYAVGGGMTKGLWLDRCTNVTIRNSKFTHTVFPVYVTNCRNILMQNITLQYAAQAQKRINPGDPATGAGIKFIDCENIKATGISGYRNANATVEIESHNRNVEVQGSSREDYDSSLTIMASENVKVDWKAEDVQHGPGVIIINTYSPTRKTQNISGNIAVHRTPWCGLIIKQTDAAQDELRNVNINLTTSENGHAALLIENASSRDLKIADLTVDVRSSNDGWGDGSVVRAAGKITGRVTGYATGAAPIFPKNARIPLGLALDLRKK